MGVPICRVGMDTQMNEWDTVKEGRMGDGINIDALWAVTSHLDL